MNSEKMTIEAVKEYYGKVLKSNKDLKTSACCTTDSVPARLREVLRDIHPEVVSKFYGCGSPIPPELSGKKVLDLGSGSGRDCFVLSKLVGPEGRVIGVDMTAEQLTTARQYIGYHTDKFGFKKPNVEFLQGYIEDLGSVGIEDNSVDVVVSNCVLNLSPDKERVFSEVFRVLKPGGEFYFSDVFSGSRVPRHLAEDPMVLGECLGGALYTEDFRRLMAKVGCADFRVLSKSKITLNSPEIEQKAGRIDFFSITIRAFKLDRLEDRCEDYGQVAYYLGTIPDSPHSFTFDDHHVFKTGQPLLVCSNTALMLSGTRYAKHFKIIGDTSTHHGLFDCGPAPASSSNTKSGAPGACC
ncbi:MAG: methyltransferase domain-containing protein [Bacteriovoracia bacterium]